MIKLVRGMQIKALEDLRGVSNSYNTPERIDISKGTILLIPREGYANGDVFCKIISGECIKTVRPSGEKVKLRINHSGDVVGLSGGHESAAYGLGRILKNKFKEVC